MLPINSNNISESPFSITEKMNAKELEFFNSVFSSTAMENNSVEASDFVNYTRGENAYIDKLIREKITWTSDLIRNVIDSIKALRKSTSQDVANKEVQIVANDENADKIYVSDCKGNRRGIDVLSYNLSFVDETGKSQNLRVNISQEFLKDYTSSNKGNGLEDLLGELTANINKLYPNVKNDLSNEIVQLNLLSYRDTKESENNERNGYYDTSNNQIFLLSNRDGVKIKDKTQTLIHEMGHAVDSAGSENASKSLNDKFEKLKALLVNKGLIPSNYATLHAGNSYYPLRTVEEFFAEIIYNDENGGIKEYQKLHKALKDPEVLPLLSELINEGRNIINNRRKSSRADRIGINVGDLKYQLETDEKASDAYAKLTCALEGELFEKYGRGRLDNLLKAYYEYKKNPTSNSEGVELINSFIKNNPTEWALVEKILNAHLEEQGLI